MKKVIIAFLILAVSLVAYSMYVTYVDNVNATDIALDGVNGGQQNIQGYSKLRGVIQMFPGLAVLSFVLYVIFLPVVGKKQQ